MEKIDNFDNNSGNQDESIKNSDFQSIENINLNYKFEEKKEPLMNNGNFESDSNFIWKDFEINSKEIFPINHVENSTSLNDSNKFDKSLINKETKESETNKTLKLGEDFKKTYDYVKNFEWTKEMENDAKKILDENKERVQDKFLNLQARNWDKFYKHNTTNFFKDRHYILGEFPELKDDNREAIVFLDIGCGVGNSFYPLLERKKGLLVNGFDISKNAIDMAKTHKLYNSEIINIIPLDIVKEEIPENFKKADYGMLMFVLSAINPNDHELVIKKIYNSINIDGILYFRDYARYDMAQMRFSSRKKNKVEENLYIRHDKTLAFFFDKDEIENLFIKVGFKIIESHLICRLIENRKDNKKMHRLWLQIKLKK